MQQIIKGNIRVQLLDADTVRIEYAKDGKFCDENTFFVPHRTEYKGAECTENGGKVCFGGYALHIPVNAKSLAGVKLEKDGKTVYEYKPLKNCGELPALDSTPEVFALSDTPRITVPEGGYSADRKGEYTLEENVEDIYLLFCKEDAVKLRKLYVGLTGRPELVRLSTLGGWNSKYYAYTEEEAKQVILDYEKHRVPLDVIVIDTDWRKCEGGMGYDINTKLFPDMKRFMDFAHAHGVEVMFNDHPEPVDGAPVFAPEEIAYREKNLQAIMDLGLDIWWYDRNWSTVLNTPSKNVDCETFGLYLFADITKNYWSKVAKDTEIYRRPVIMGNVDNIINGNYAGIQNSASHRYSIQWTGDVSSDYDSLAQEIKSLNLCGANAIPYVNADCGGHVGNPDKEQFIRWMQFGTLSPVFRPHCTNWVSRWRDPWAYDEETLDIVREYNNLRYRLLPVIYRGAYESYKTGVPFFRPLGFNYPEDKTALPLTNEYMLCEDLLISPVCGLVPELVTEQYYTAPVKAVYFDGRELEGEPLTEANYKSLNMVLNHTAPEKGVPVYDFSARFQSKIKFPFGVKLYVCSDDGCTVWINGEKVHEDKTLHGSLKTVIANLDKNVEYDIRIDYFQAGGEACCSLYYVNLEQDERHSVYLPKGKWLDVFGGSIHEGGRAVFNDCKLSESPLYVRMGSLIPLAYEARNTGLQKWNRLVYDFYPCKTASDKGYIYEDDTETTAYKLGHMRTSPYEAHYDKQSDAYVITLGASEGSFAGDKCFKEREITLKCHLTAEAGDIKRVTVNGKETQFKKNARVDGAFPLSVSEACRDSDTVTVRLKTDVNETYEIKLWL